jgi:hypothetical protein
MPKESTTDGAEGLDPRAQTRSTRSPFEGGGDVVEQPDAVGAAQLQHDRAGGLVVEPQHPRRGGGLVRPPASTARSRAPCGPAPAPRVQRPGAHPHQRRSGPAPGRAGRRTAGSPRTSRPRPRRTRRERRRCAPAASAGRAPRRRPTASPAPVGQRDGDRRDVVVVAKRTCGSPAAVTASTISWSVPSGPARPGSTNGRPSSADRQRRGQPLDQGAPPRAPDAGPGAERVGLGERAEQLEEQRHVGVAPAGRCAPPRRSVSSDPRHRRRVLRVATGRRVRQQQVVAHHRARAARGRPRAARAARPICTDQRLPHHRVVTAAALADVVQQRADQQQVRPRDPGGEPGDLGTDLDEVAVDRPDVRAVARGQVADGAPLREQPPPQPGAVQRLDRPRRRPCRCPSSGEQLGQRGPRPRCAQLRGGVGEPVTECPRRSGARCGRRWRRPAAPGPGPSPRRVAGERDLPRVLDDAGVERAAHRRAAERGEPPAGQRVRDWRSPTSAAKATARAAPDRARARSKRSPTSRIVAMSSASWARRTSRARPESRCSSVRTSSSSARAATTSGPGRSTSWAVARASSSCTSRRPPWPFFRSGSMRWATSPLRRQRSVVVSTISSKRLRIPARQAARTASRTLAVSVASPATCRSSSSPSAARRSVAAICTACPGVRTEWSSPIPASQSGYQSFSASASTSVRPSCRSTRSRSDQGHSSRRPSAPTAASAVPLPSPPTPSAAHREESQKSCRSTSAARNASGPWWCRPLGFQEEPISP